MINLAYADGIAQRIIYILLIVFAYVKWDDIKQILSEKGGGLSSKRVIAIMGMSTLCKLALYVTHPDKPVDGNILLVLTVIILLASTIATFPQVLDLLSKVKNIVPSKEEKVTLTEKKKEEKTVERSIETEVVQS